MRVERRGRPARVVWRSTLSGEEPTDEPKPNKRKSFVIAKWVSVFEAWEKVKANDGAPGVDACRSLCSEWPEGTTSTSCGI